MGEADTPADTELAAGVGFALTGEWLPLNGMAGLPDDLAALGFDGARLAGIRAGRQQQRQPWPLPLPLEERRRLGFARFDAALADARTRLGLTGLAAAARPVRPLNRDELRLEADRPPHW